jgi:hypothetical protein
MIGCCCIMLEAVAGRGPPIVAPFAEDAFESPPCAVGAAIATEETG